MENISSPELKDRDIFYFRQRQKNRVFSQLAAFFAAEAERTGLTKRAIAERLNKDPAQITRWLSEPKNLTLDTISDILLALGAEMEFRVVKFSDRAQSTIVHPVIAAVVSGAIEKRATRGSSRGGGKARPVRAGAR